MEELQKVRQLLNDGKTEEAISVLKSFLLVNKDSDEAYFLLGNAYRKQENWELALNNYAEAIELNPNSPAQLAYKATIDVLNFFNKDMYNQ